MAVPYTFGTATSSIPLSQLDNNFATAITIGNTAVYLGNTTTSFGNVTLNNANITSVAATFPNSFLANSTTTIGNTTVTLGSTSSSIGNLTLNNVTVASGNVTLTSATVPTVIGGTTASSTLTLESTSGTGTSDAILFKTGSQSTRMYIDTSGNVGIGTTSPVNNGSTYSTLTLNGTSSGILQIQANGSSAGQILSRSSTNLYITGVNSTVFETGGANERMRIDASGNVGIGTSSISYRLDVLGTTPIRHQYTGSSGGILFGQYDSTGNAQIQNQSTSGIIAFATNNSERMRVDASGNVGIGTSSPNASAILDAQSTTKGVRFPNMTTTQKNAISSPAAGLVVFDTTLSKLCVYSGSAWQTITSV